MLVCAPVVCALYVHQGELKATKGGTEGEVCPRLHTSDYFGEIALILDRVRAHLLSPPPPPLPELTPACGIRTAGDGAQPDVDPPVY